MKQVRSIQRALEIVDSFRLGQSKGVSEISREMGIPKSTAHEILATLVEAGVLARDDVTGLFQLGTKLIELGNRARSNYPLNRAAEPFIKALRDEFDETVFLTLLERDQVFYLDCYESTRRLRIFSTLGDRAPLYCTSLGKAILAAMPPDELDRYLSSVKLEPFTVNTITDPVLLREDIERTARRGYAVDDMEHEEGVRCLGAAIRNEAGRPIGAVSVSGAAGRISGERVAEIAVRVVAAAEGTSRAMGYRPGESRQNQ